MLFFRGINHFIYEVATVSARGVYYVTTPIYYANGRPHLGNTYTTTVADSLTRFYRYLGYETFFLTGTDEHGDKVAQAAEAAGKTPFDFTTDVSELFKRTWKELGLEYSRFIRTTDSDHKKVVQDILQRIFDKGDIYFGEYGGLYCVGCERFLTEKELVEGNCPDHQTPPKFVKENNYFFKMSNYQDRLLHHITKTSPDFIRPERYKNEVLALLREPLEDLCISRPKSRLTWGIELPFDKNYVTYVWFDALLNYVSGLGYPNNPEFKTFWPAAEHLIAKDIVKPHGVFWPTMLMAADIPLFKHLNVHGYWVTPKGKMSKTVGNVIDPVAIKNEFGMDVFRYHVFREMVYGLDGTFTFESLETRYNADLANNLGNLVSRTLAMVHRYRKGVIPAPGDESELERELKANALSCLNDLTQCITDLEIHRGLERVWQLVNAVNIYIDRTKPWALAKETENQDSVQALDTTLYYQLECIRIVASLISAFLPNTSERILSYLGCNMPEEQTATAASKWGGLKPGQSVQKGEALFPRSDIKEKENVSAEAQQDSNTNNTASYITYDDFAKIQLRVGQILEASKVEKSDKLVQLKVDLGETRGPRQILAGIGKHYTPEVLVGRKVAVVANLAPRKMMGMMSEGMLLAASDDAGNLELVNIPPLLPPGSRIS